MHAVLQSDDHDHDGREAGEVHDEERADGEQGVQFEATHDGGGLGVAEQADELAETLATLWGSEKE